MLFNTLTSLNNNDKIEFGTITIDSNKITKTFSFTPRVVFLFDFQGEIGTGSVNNYVYEAVFFQDGGGYAKLISGTSSSNNSGTYVSVLEAGKTVISGATLSISQASSPSDGSIYYDTSDVITGKSYYYYPRGLSKVYYIAIE